MIFGEKKVVFIDVSTFFFDMNKRELLFKIVYTQPDFKFERQIIFQGIDKFSIEYTSKENIQNDYFESLYSVDEEILDGYYKYILNTDCREVVLMASKKYVKSEESFREQKK